MARNDALSRPGNCAYSRYMAYQQARLLWHLRLSKCDGSRLGALREIAVNCELAAGYLAKVQTFLPFPDFAACARVLDQRRLGKQRVEALQVLRALTTPDYGWRHHPAPLMWAGYEEALVRYGLEICREWTDSGYADTCAALLVNELAEQCRRSQVRDQDQLSQAGETPPWLGNVALHRSHQSALIRKDPTFYQEIFVGVPRDLPYEWPTSDRSPCTSRS